MITIQNTANSLAHLSNLLDKHGRVFFTRFGDNDIMMMTGSRIDGQPLGHNSYGGNKTVYSQKLSDEIKAAFNVDDQRFAKGVSCSWEKEPGMRDGVFAPFPYNKQLSNKIESLTKERDFLNPILFHYLILFRPDVFDSFVAKYIKPYKKLFIGTVSPESASKIIGEIDHYVYVPPENAHAGHLLWWPKIKEIIDNNDIKVVIPTAGQATRAIQHRLWETGKDMWSIDMGSLFDALDSRQTRTWLRKEGHKIRARYNKN